MTCKIIIFGGENKDNSYYYFLSQLGKKLKNQGINPLFLNIKNKDSMQDDIENFESVQNLCKEFFDNYMKINIGNYEHYNFKPELDFNSDMILPRDKIKFEFSQFIPFLEKIIATENYHLISCFLNIMISSIPNIKHYWTDIDEISRKIFEMHKTEEKFDLDKLKFNILEIFGDIDNQSKFIGKIIKSYVVETKITFGSEFIIDYYKSILSGEFQFKRLKSESFVFKRFNIHDNRDSIMEYDNNLVIDMANETLTNISHDGCLILVGVNKYSLNRIVAELSKRKEEKSLDIELISISDPASSFNGIDKFDFIFKPCAPYDEERKKFFDNPPSYTMSAVPRYRYCEAEKKYKILNGRIDEIDKLVLSISSQLSPKISLKLEDGEIKEIVTSELSKDRLTKLGYVKYIFTETRNEDLELRKRFIRLNDSSAQFIPNKNAENSFIGFFKKEFSQEFRKPLSEIRKLFNVQSSFERLSLGSPRLFSRERIR